MRVTSKLGTGLAGSENSDSEALSESAKGASSGPTPSGVSGMPAPSLLDTLDTCPSRTFYGGGHLWELELWLDQASTGCGLWGRDLELPRGLPPNHHSSYTSTTCDVNLGSLHTSSSNSSAGFLELGMV